MAERQHINIGKGVDPNALYDVAFDLAETYEKLLEQDGVNATKELSNAAKQYVFQWRGDVLQLIFRLPEHWYYVEHGRSPSMGQTGKMWADPVADIMRWMQAKHLVPRTQMRSARVPVPKKDVDPMREAAENIVRKIHRRGFYTSSPTDYGPHGKRPLWRATMEVELVQRLKNVLIDAYGKEIKVELGDIAESVKQSQNS